MEEEITLSKRQQECLVVLIEAINGNITNEEASRRLGLSVRQIQRKKKAYRGEGARSLAHKNKGKPPINVYSEQLKKYIVELYRSEYSGWNFCHFNDQLADEHDIIVSYSFLRRILIENGIKSPRRNKHKRKAHPPRERKENAGELIQVDASKHRWLYNTEEYQYLHGAIDDATGTVTACIMMKEECSLGYQLLLRDTIVKYGMPCCLYTDYRTVFQVTKKLSVKDVEAGRKLTATRFAEMCGRNGIEIRSTIDPRAKGRIERLWNSFQDRLVKELARSKIDTIEEANKYINEVFLQKYNAKFASPIDYTSHNLFYTVGINFDCNYKLALRYPHKVLERCYVKMDNTYYVIQKDGKDYHLDTYESVDVYKLLDGTLCLQYKDDWYGLRRIEAKPKHVYVRKTKNDEELRIARSEAAKKGAANSPWRNNMSAFFRPKS